MAHPQRVAPVPTGPHRMQHDMDLLLLHLLEFQGHHGQLGVRRLIHAWDWEGVLGGFELSAILQNPMTLDSVRMAQARVRAEAQVAARANLAQAIRRNKERRGRNYMAVREGSVIDRIDRIYDSVRNFVELVLRVQHTLRTIVNSERFKLVVAALLCICISLISCMLTVVVHGHFSGYTQKSDLLAISG
ncbi:hypothetical protein HBH70_226600 [Parastagonospora nodorum]|nr:hypothetical protein HBH43_239580 [Parastagonospora nodorum]KAH4251217.1 hypothetical protein HBI03_228500 [Parastagonospora nodorum]KAH4257233.1 hypothetical protein HBI04_224650 [Parastagonospora nodorum]KAH5059112.1 hypothetical protein HBH95_241570 [Parastagonospora nodorum]KAH5127631.1 hypothetical protein HBH70_226600 [Parastagonospora nodorum]